MLYHDRLLWKEWKHPITPKHTFSAADVGLGAPGGDCLKKNAK